MRRLALLTLLAAPAFAAADDLPYTPTRENLDARQRFRDMKFGLFVHWGVYSVLGDGEWVMNNMKMNVAEYEKLADRFNPTEFDAAEWVRIAKGAGMKYITVTTKHHDGFAMWDSKVGKYNIVQHTPYKKDVLRMLADECRKNDIQLFWYHSHLDWHHPEYYPWGLTGHNTGRPKAGDFDKYLDFMDAQLTELLTDYGPVGGVWFDGWWDQQAKRKGEDPKKTQVDWRMRRTYDLIHKLQPAALVGNNHHVSPFPGEDFQMFEKDLPGQNTTGLSTDAKIGSLPLESCETISRAWGYNRRDKQYKSVKELIHFLVNSAGRDANFLLNVGPMPSGRIQPEFVERLQGVGAWMKINGESIYNTRGGPVAPQTWGVTTVSKDGGTLYVHVLDASQKQVSLPRFEGMDAVLKNGHPATILGGSKRVKMNVSPDGSLVLELPADRDPIDSIIAIDLRK